MKVHTLVAFIFAAGSAGFLWQGLRPGGTFYAIWPASPIGRDRPLYYWSQAVMYAGFVVVGLPAAAHDLWSWWSLF
jgi:hypothetical protein